MEHVLGRYIISDKPMTEEELIKAHAIDVTPKEGEEKSLRHKRDMLALSH
jgi:hypothetical protein